jgi:hypothetical protein
MEILATVCNAGGHKIYKKNKADHPIFIVIYYRLSTVGC